MAILKRVVRITITVVITSGRNKLPGGPPTSKITRIVARLAHFLHAEDPTP